MEPIWSGESKSVVNLASRGKITTAKYQINGDYITVETGLLSSKVERYPMWAVRDVDFIQSLLQKARGISNFLIRFEHNDFTGKSELLLEDVSVGRELVALIIDAATVARLEHQRLAQTQHVNYQGVSPVSAVAEVPAEDVFARIEKLGLLLEKGLITQEEFVDQKTKLLNS